MIYTHSSQEVISLWSLYVHPAAGDVRKLVKPSQAKTDIPATHLQRNTFTSTEVFQQPRSNNRRSDQLDSVSTRRTGAQKRSGHDGGSVAVAPTAHTSRNGIWFQGGSAPNASQSDISYIIWLYSLYCRYSHISTERYRALLAIGWFWVILSKNMGFICFKHRVELACLNAFFVFHCDSPALR